MTRLLGLLLLAAILAPAPAPARAAASRPAKVPADWIGVTADGPLIVQPAARDGEWDRMRAAGVGFVRIAFYWRELQATPDALDLRVTDQLVAAAAARRLRVLPVVVGAPAWAALDPGDLGSPPRSPQAFAELLKVLVARYGPAGTLWSDRPDLPREAIRAWQIWNEPSLPAYWSRQPFAARYVELLRASRAALTSADPRARLVLAGLPNRSWLALRAIYRQGGRGSFDAVALHPYTSRVTQIVKLVRLARKEMRRAHDTLRPVWLTEVSWPASLSHTKVTPGGFEVSEAGQARRLRATFMALARVRRALRIAHIVWYTWISAEGRSTPTWAGYAGLRRVRGAGTITAPSLAVFRRTVARLRR